ncbi:MAG: metal dependent phosphohydrolase [Candidatus Frackibacter sp. T328-2]|nr:MAG: metal dependent phosphohydrolase [Candidatus Frackibacter sp. T328-2]
MRLRLKLFLIIEYITFALSFSYLYQNHSQLIPWYDFAFFTIALFILSNLTTLVNKGIRVNTSLDLPILLSAIVVLDPFWVAIVAMVATIKINKIKIDFTWHKFIFNRTMFFVATGSAALIFRISQKHFNTPYYFLSLLFTAITFIIVNNILVYLVIKFEKKKNNFSFLQHMIKVGKKAPSTYLLGQFLYFVYINFDKGFFILGIIFTCFLLELFYTHVQQVNHSTQIVKSFLKVINSKDNYTEGHCQRVASYTKLLCKKLGLGPSQSNCIIQMAKIHDVGKLNVSDEILSSSSRLTKDQKEEVRMHSLYGYQILQDIELLNENLDIILYHHEYYDGSGYPEGIRGEEIPLGARILAVCDAFDVMTYGRAYQAPMTKERVIQEFKDCTGTQFDPQISQAMIELIEADSFNHIFADNIAKYEQRYETVVELSS